MNEDRQPAVEAAGDVVGTDPVPAPAPATLPAARARGARSVADVLEEINCQQAFIDQRALMEAYEQACEELLGPDDFQEDAGETFKRKSAWRTLARHFRVSTEVVICEGWWEDLEWEDTPHYVARVTVRAVALWGQYMTAVGKCSTREDRFIVSGPLCPGCGSEMWDNREQALFASDFRCKRCSRKLMPGAYDPDELSVDEPAPDHTARAKAEHDVEATAQTRATNRAISDLIAGGEVSAEEVEAGIHAGDGRAPETSGERSGDGPGRRRKLKQKLWRAFGRYAADEDYRLAYLEAFAASYADYPDELEDWLPKDFERAIEHLDTDGVAALRDLDPGTEKERTE